MKNFLPFIILILIASLFAILAFYTSKVIEGNTQKKDCEYKWGEWSNCVNLKQTRQMQITQQPENGGRACPTQEDQTETRFCATSSLTPNSATDCTRPNDVTGYEFTSEKLLKSDFEVRDLKCADGYYGTPAAVACNSVGQPYSLQGCNKISIEVNTANPRHLIVNFAKDASIEGSPGDLKNNFKYKVIEEDNSFKKVENAIVTSPTQIKLILNADIKINQTVLVKYEQNKGKNNGGAELKINDITVDTIDQIPVVNNIIDNINPKVRVIVVENADPQKIKLLMTEHLSPNDNIDKNDFKISVDGGASRTPNKVTIDGNTMIVHLRSPVTQNQTVKLEYKYDGTDSEKQVKDLNGNLLLDIENLTAINNVGYPNRDLSILSEYTPAEDVEQPDSKDTDSSQQNNVNQYGPRDEAYFNEQYIKSMGAHNPFNYINDLNNIDCKIDPFNKNRAICDLKRNQPIKQYNLDELEDNRGDEKDKYILKTKIVPVVTPACPTCLDDEKDSPTPGLKLNKSLSKLFDVEENLKLDNYDRTVKKNPNLQINKGLKNLMDKVNKNMPQLNKNLSKDLKGALDETIGPALNTMVPEMITPEMSGPQSSSPQFNMPQVNTPLFKDSLNMPKMTPSMKTPSLNPEVSNVIDKTLDTVSKAAETVNIDTRMLNHNKPTALTHEIAHIKSEGRSGGFIPMLTSFSAF
tara:strand:+ start:7866 stop:9944 length:2079 start_codon:yes stop_codon:yes gene_type:complete